MSLRKCWRAVAVVTCAAVGSLAMFANPSHAAIIGTYVDAKALAHPDGVGDTTVYAGSFNTGPSTNFDSTYTDNSPAHWEDRGFATALNSAGNESGPDGNVIEATGDSTIPTITTSVTGLTSATYKVYVVYWSLSDGNGDWSIRAKLNSSAFTASDEYGNGSFLDGPGFGATTDTGTVDSGRHLFEAYIGTFTGSAFDLYVLNTTKGVSQRTWYEGVAYQAQSVPEPASLALLIGFAPLVLRRRAAR